MKKLGMVMAMMLIAGVACAQEQLAIGAKAPGFSLVNAVDGETVTMTPDDGRIKVVVFTCNQCPYAKAFEPRIIELAKQFGQKGVRFYAIDPNDDARYAEETLENMKARAVEKKYPFPYLKDGDSAIARAYGARVTPHVFILPRELDALVPDDRGLYPKTAATGVPFVALVCHPTTATNADPHYLLPGSTEVVPRMQPAGEMPKLAPGRFPLIVYSHGLGRSPVGKGYVHSIVALASYGYVVMSHQNNTSPGIERHPSSPSS